MAALPTIDHVLRVALNWTSDSGQTAVNVMHFYSEEAGATPEQLATDLDAQATGSMWGCIVPSASVSDIAITPLDGSTATSHYTPATPAHWVGQNGTDFVPQVAAIIKLTTGLRGRSHRGRLFLPFIEEGAISNGLLLSATRSGVEGAWQDFGDHMLATAHVWALGVASYKLATFEGASTITCEGVLGTQRRRQGRLRAA